MGHLSTTAVPGQALHVIQRGGHRRAMFLCEQDCRVYLEALRGAAQTFGVAIHAYALLPDHVQLLATPVDRAGPARVLRTVAQRYGRYLGGVGAGGGTARVRYHRMSVIDADQYLNVCLRYIETDAVRTGMVREPRAYRWTSYGHNALGRRDALLTEHPRYLALGATGAARRAAYRALCDVPLSGDEVDAIHLALETGARLGDEPLRGARGGATALRRARTS